MLRVWYYNMWLWVIDFRKLALYGVTFPGNFEHQMALHRKMVSTFSQQIWFSVNIVLVKGSIYVATC